jgi:hypothetical protein
MIGTEGMAMPLACRSEGDQMAKKAKAPLVASGTWNAALLALVVFLAAVLYLFGTALSGEPSLLGADTNGSIPVDAGE